MQKSPDITKYNDKWQLTRLKAKQAKTAQEKIDIAIGYLNTEKTKDAWERVYNWLEGLERGYRGKNDDAVGLANSYLSTLQQTKSNYTKKEQTLTGDAFNGASSDDLVKLYKDLFYRNRKWLENGYVNTELNSYMDRIENTLNTRGDVSLLDDFPEKINQLRNDANNKNNTHNFFF